ncbi:hypothetical protein BDY19DRAFT_346425 [Irpex rosettiformis]|uniref:Uncharacterized protein n=1 Tax=Irpex rosettiformis TaxID=378272 RepID=A0ACB8TWR6_9APHY|nr:hypothetical protein BDY19DRAFT_346425 [Irpex rosettiformis]
MSTTLVPSGISQKYLWTVVDDAFGAGIGGSWVAMFLCGICIAQAYHYFHAYSEDGLWTKVAAWTVTLMNLIHVIFVCGANYFYLVKTAREQDIIAKAHVNWTLPAAIASHIIISGIVFSYYIFICYYLLSTKKSIVQKAAMVVLILAPIAAHVCLGITAVVKTCEIKSLFDVPSFRESTMIPMLSTQVIADITISSMLCFALPKPTHQITRDVTRSIVVYTVSRGIITAVTALAELMMLVLAPKDLWFIAIEFIIPGLYANSFFSALNTRRRIRKHLENSSNATPPMAIPLGFYRPRTDGDADDDDATSNGNPTLPKDGIQVEVYTIQKHDDPCEKA